MVKKLYTRMAVAITSVCNQKCAWCFEGSWTQQKPPLYLSLDNMTKLLEWKDWSTGRIPVITLYGGEPTLHPQLLEMIDLISKYNSKISIVLLTNLACDKEIIKELVCRGVNIIPNVDQFEEDNNSSNSSMILTNLNYLNSLSSEKKYSITVTVSDAQKDFDFLYEIVKRGGEHILNLRIAPSSPGFEFKNKFQREPSFDIYDKILDVVTQCKKISPSLTFSSECPANYCIISKQTMNELERQGYKLKRFCGELGPNADILADLSCCWCFAFHKNPEMSVNNVFDYPSYESMVAALKNKFDVFQKKFPNICKESVNCKNIHCSGFCPAYNYYYWMKNNK